jgi:hypothetical protein
MPVDGTIVGHVAQDVMGQLEQRFGDDEDANVRAVFLIAAAGKNASAAAAAAAVSSGESTNLEQSANPSQNNGSQDSGGFFQSIIDFLFG